MKTFKDLEGAGLNLKKKGPRAAAHIGRVVGRGMEKISNTAGGGG